MATRDPEGQYKCGNLLMLSKATVTFHKFKFWSCKGFSHLQIDNFITKDRLGLSRSVVEFSENIEIQCLLDHFEFQIRDQKPTAKSASHHFSRFCVAKSASHHIPNGNNGVWVV